MTTTVVYHMFAMPFSIQRGRPLKFVVYHRVVLGVKKQHLYVTYGKVTCLVTLTDLQMHRAGLSASADLLVA